jgi:hypothetical protein
MRKKLGDRGRRGPSEPTFRRVLNQVDVAEIDRKLGEWTSRRIELCGEAVAFDGKTIRGSQDGETGPAVHLMSAVLHRDATVLRQNRVPDKTNEIKAAIPLLKDLDLEGATVTADAMHTQKELAKFLVEEKKADYVFTVKDNQPTLKADIEALGLGSFPPGARADEQRTRPDRDPADLDE